MDKKLHFRPATQVDIETIQGLAYTIWPHAYGSLLTGEQIEYMLNMFYSKTSLMQQMESDGHLFIIAGLDGEPVGFASYGTASDPGRYKLHKLYVLQDLHGKGVGRLLLNEVMGHLAILKATSLILNVNRHNPARHFYHKLGFEIIREEVNDIGNGFVMDDYVMEKKLS